MDNFQRKYQIDPSQDEELRRLSEKTDDLLERLDHLSRNLNSKIQRQHDSQPIILSGDSDDTPLLEGIRSVHSTGRPFKTTRKTAIYTEQHVEDSIPKEPDYTHLHSSTAQIPNIPSMGFSPSAPLYTTPDVQVTQRLHREAPIPVTPIDHTQVYTPTPASQSLELRSRINRLNNTDSGMDVLKWFATLTPFFAFALSFAFLQGADFAVKIIASCTAAFFSLFFSCAAWKLSELSDTVKSLNRQVVLIQANMNDNSRPSQHRGNVR